MLWRSCGNQVLAVDGDGKPDSMRRFQRSVMLSEGRPFAERMAGHSRSIPTVHRSPAGFWGCGWRSLTRAVPCTMPATGSGVGMLRLRRDGRFATVLAPLSMTRFQGISCSSSSRDTIPPPSPASVGFWTRSGRSSLRGTSLSTASRARLRNERRRRTPSRGVARHRSGW